MAYISADVPLVDMARDLDRLKQLCPQLVIAKTMLAGHFNTIEVADQVNAMIERFLAVVSERIALQSFLNCKAGLSALRRRRPGSR
jgi:hypothetical protein